jgi:predicted O-methyltransferase YrrM
MLKKNYLNYFELIIPKWIKAESYYLTMYLEWKVLEQLQPNDLSTKILLEYNKLLANDPRVETVLLPIRDGLTVSACCNYKLNRYWKLSSQPDGNENPTLFFAWIVMYSRK